MMDPETPSDHNIQAELQLTPALVSPEDQNHKSFCYCAKEKAQISLLDFRHKPGAKRIDDLLIQKEK